MDTSSLMPLSRSIATHSAMKMLSVVWRGLPTFMKTATVPLGSVRANTSSVATHLVVQSSNHDANWYIVVGIFAGASNTWTEWCAMECSLGLLLFGRANQEGDSTITPKKCFNCIAGTRDRSFASIRMANATFMGHNSQICLSCSPFEDECAGVTPILE